MFTVYFEAPYWVGVLEEERDGLLFAARHIFGAEPSDQEVYEFVLQNYYALKARMTIGISIDSQTNIRAHVNPKRVQREVRKAVSDQGISTRAQEAMRLQIEANKQERKLQSREEREAAKERKRAIAREKARAKHRGH